MKRMKTFFIYLLLVIGVIIATNIVPNIIFETNYRPITDYQIKTESPEIIISEAKATKANGTINGTIKNNTEKFMENYYIKIELLSDIGNVLGEEYIQAGNFQPGQEKNFELSFRYNNVKGFIATATNETTEREIQYHPLIEHFREYYILARIMIFIVNPAFSFWGLIFK